ncbi:MAG: methylamine dehydrogenase light chain [Myxococcota bacterium]
MTRIDAITQALARRVASHTSRRSLLAFFGRALVGGAALPLLPVARIAAGATPSGVQDPSSCDYWRFCAIDGFLCSCCGGSASSCPAGTTPSPMTWVGTCQNPADGKSYVVSYNDCCGTQSCGRCLCNRNEGDRPPYLPWISNDINWCLGSDNRIAYHCSTAVLVSLADK